MSETRDPRTVNNFDVLKEMGRRNGNIMMAPLSNFIRAKQTKFGVEVTIGVGGDSQAVIAGLLQGTFCGGLVLADSTEFDAIKAELKEALHRAD